MITTLGNSMNAPRDFGTKGQPRPHLDNLTGAAVLIVHRLQQRIPRRVTPQQLECRVEMEGGPESEALPEGSQDPLHGLIPVTQQRGNFGTPPGFFAGAGLPWAEQTEAPKELIYRRPVLATSTAEA